MNTVEDDYIMSHIENIKCKEKLFKLTLVTGAHLADLILSEISCINMVAKQSYLVNNKFELCTFERGEFYRLSIHNCEFTLTVMDGSKINDCTLIATQLEKMCCAEVDFNNMTTIGTVFKECDIHKTKIRNAYIEISRLEKVKLIETEITNSIFGRVMLKSVSFKNSSIVNTTMCQVSIVDSDPTFINCTINNTHIKNCPEKITLTQCRVIDCTFNNCVLEANKETRFVKCAFFNSLINGQNNTKLEDCVFADCVVTESP